MIPLRIWWLSLAAAATFSFVSLPPASGQTPPVAAAPNDPFGKEVSLVEKNIVYVVGSGMWDSAFSTIVAAFKTVCGAVLFVRRGLMHLAILPQPEHLPGVGDALQTARRAIEGNRFGQVGGSAKEDFSPGARHELISGDAGKDKIDRVSRRERGDIAAVPIENAASP